MKKNTSRRGRLTASAAAGVLLTSIVLGTTACAPVGQSATALNTPSVSTIASAPVPSSPTSNPSPSAIPTTTPVIPVKPATVGPILSASVPLRLQAPSVGIDTALVPLGQAADGTMDVPGGQNGDPGGWYKYSPSPGELGPAVLLGHVNTVSSPVGLFFRLNQMKPGEEFSVIRADNTVAVFQVDKLIEVKKATFPTLAVYGNTDRAEIRLITCGGFDAASQEYTENTVVYGHLVSSHQA